MSSDDSSSSKLEVSKEIIDLCCTEEFPKNDNSFTNEVEIVTPNKSANYDVVNDIQKAIAASTFSAMYPDEFQDKGQTIVTPHQQVTNGDTTNKSMLGLGFLDLSQDFEDSHTDQHQHCVQFNQYCEKDEYYQSTPLFRALHDRIFNPQFLEFFMSLQNSKPPYPELLKVRVIEHDITEIEYVLMCYTRDRSDYNTTYNRYCEFDRDKIPKVVITSASSYYDVYEDDHFGAIRDILHSIQLKDEFVSLMQIYSSMSNMKVHSDYDVENLSDKGNTHTNTVTAIVPYIPPTCVPCNQLPTTHNICNHVSYPPFYSKLKEDRSLSTQEIATEFLKSDWITAELWEEIVEHVPSASDIDLDDDSNLPTKTTASFETKCHSLFPLGRQFANYKQLEQYVTLFCKSWSVLKHREGNSFKCFYAPSTKKKKVTDFLFQESSTSKKSMKDIVQCPFIIRFSIPGVKNKSLPSIFYTVKITHVNANHTCKLSSYSFRTAKRISTSAQKIDINALKVVLHCLKLDPHLPSLHLRPLLASCLPLDTDLSKTLIKTIRRRCMLHLAMDGNTDDMEVDKANKILSSSDITDEELKALDSPHIIENFRAIYARIMQNSSESWKALALLKELRSKLTGFDFRIRFNNEKLPIGIVWMTFTMRQHLLRYGDIIFLDAQKRQYNKLSWPYIGPTIKTNENTIRVVAESIVLSEDISTYQWILESIAEIEPKWDIKSLKIIFADGLITQSLLNRLNINQSCTLRSDYWHLMNEVFPKEHNFGSFHFGLIKNHLKKMLLSDTILQWQNAYKEAKLILRDYPLKCEKLSEIYDRPSYYAGYYVRKIDNNLLLAGNSPAESNHSSIVSNLGPGGIWTISNQITKLMDRQQNFINRDRAISDDLFVRQNFYRSTFLGELAKSDVTAKKSLSNYAYQKFWKNALQVSDKYQTKVGDIGGQHIIWKCGEVLKDDNFVVIPNGGNCTCKYRIAYGCPCAHELAINKKFVINQYSNRWLCDTSFQQRFEHLSPTTIVTNELHYDVTSGPKENLEREIETTGHSSEFTQHEVPNNSNRSGETPSIDYVELTRVANELIRCAVNDSNLCNKIYRSLVIWTQKLRNKDEFEISFLSGKKLSTNAVVDVEKDSNLPLPASVRPAQVNAAQKRKKSIRERQLARKSSKTSSSSDVIAECTLLPHGTNGTKSCGLCKGRGHNRMRCQRLLHDFGQYPIPLSDQSQRKKVALSLNAVEFNGSPIFRRPFNDKRSIIKEFPKHVKCLVIHQRYLINGNVSSLYSNNNICIECTIIRQDYGILENEKKILFDPGSLLGYIMKGCNLVCSQI